MTDFAIVTPTLNHGRYLPQTIASVRSQHGVTLDYLIRDGGSTDNTLPLLDQLAIRYISQRDAGQADAINKGFAQTTGQILGWLNADDRYTPGALRAVAHAFSQNPSAALVYGQAIFIDTRGRRIGPCTQVEPPSYHRLLTRGDYIIQPAAFFRRSTFTEAGGLDSSLHWAMDYDLWLKLTARHKAVFINRILAEYRWDGHNKTATNPSARLEEIHRIIHRHSATRLPAFFAIESAAHTLAHHHYTAAIRQLAHLPTLATLLSPRTWRIIHTRFRLRSITSASRAR